MKSLIVLSILLTICIASSLAGVEERSLYNPTNPDKCTVSDSLVIATGETVQDPNEECGKIKCGEGGKALFVTCGEYESQEGCKQGDYIDRNLPYPKCCERHLNCVSENKLGTPNGETS